MDFVSDLKAWALQVFFRKDYFALVSRGTQDGGRPVRLAKTGKLDNSLLNMGTGSGLDADLLDGLTSSQFVRNTQITASNNLGGSPAINQLILSTLDVPATGYVTLPNEARFLLAHRTGGSNTSNCILHLAVGGTITSYGAAGINLTNTGNDCVYWDAGSTTYRIGNNSGSVRTWRILLIRG